MTFGTTHFSLAHHTCGAGSQVGSTAFPRNFTVAPDGKRMVVLGPRNEATSPASVHLTFFSNFLDQLQRVVR